MSDFTNATSGSGGHPEKSLTDAIEAMDIDSPSIAPNHDASAVKSGTEYPGPEKSGPAKSDTPPLVSKLMIMAPSPRRDWSDMRVDPETVIDHDDKAAKAGRKFPAMAAMIALAAIAGAIGGAGATAGLSWGSHAAEQTTAAAHVRSLDDTIMRIEGDLASLKTSVEKVSKANVTLASKATDRFDKLEKAQADPAAKIAKLTETIEKLRTAAATPQPAPAPAPVPVAAAVAPAPREVTGSIPAPKPEIARLPIVDGWVLRGVERDSAVIEGRPGIFEVFAGDPVPGLGKVDAIRRQDGRWVVVTSKGLIVSR